jgi:surface antigen
MSLNTKVYIIGAICLASLLTPNDANATTGPLPEVKIVSNISIMEEKQIKFIETKKAVDTKKEEIKKAAEKVEAVKEEAQTIVESKKTIEQEIAQLKADIEYARQQAAVQAQVQAQTQVSAYTQVQSSVSSVQSPIARNYNVNSAGNGYTPGQCTFYVKNRRPDIPNNWGNANMWASSARASGYTVSSVPIPGAIAASNYEMHVAYVESVQGNTVTISEMNYGGPWNMNTRTVPAHNFTYIY